MQQESLVRAGQQSGDCHGAGTGTAAFPCWGFGVITIPFHRICRAQPHGETARVLGSGGSAVRISAVAPVRAASPSRTLITFAHTHHLRPDSSASRWDRTGCRPCMSEEGAWWSSYGSPGPNMCLLSAVPSGQAGGAVRARRQRRGGDGPSVGPILHTHLQHCRPHPSRRPGGLISTLTTGSGAFASAIAAAHSPLQSNHANHHVFRRTLLFTRTSS